MYLIHRVDGEWGLQIGYELLWDLHLAINLLLPFSHPWQPLLLIIILLLLLGLSWHAQQ